MDNTERELLEVLAQVHDALRAYAILTHDAPAESSRMSVTTCRLCDHHWYPNDPEDHAPDCLAAMKRVSLASRTQTVTDTQLADAWCHETDDADCPPSIVKAMRRALEAALAAGKGDCSVDHSQYVGKCPACHTKLPGILTRDGGNG